MDNLAVIKNVLQNWSIPSDILTSQAMHEKGTVALISTTDAQYILKQLGDTLSADRLQAEYAILQHLAAAGIAVAVPILADDGNPFATVREHIYTLAPVLQPTASLTVTSEDQVYAVLGQALAQLHLALASYDQDFPSWTMNLPRTLSTETIPFIEQQLDRMHKVEVAMILATTTKPLYQALTNLPMQRIHGDCHGGNILWDRSGVYGIIDLDHLPIGPRVYDIGYLLADMVKNRIHAPDQLATWLDTCGALIHGYEQEILLTQREKYTGPHELHTGLTQIG